jgi:hypothetical protein
MPYTKIAPEKLRPGHKGDLSYLVGKKVKVRVVQVRGGGVMCLDTVCANREYRGKQEQAAGACMAWGVGVSSLGVRAMVWVADRQAAGVTRCRAHIHPRSFCCLSYRHITYRA